MGDSEATRNGPHFLFYLLNDLFSNKKYFREKLAYNLLLIDIVKWATNDLLRDWSLITGRGGATKREGGAREVLPLPKGGAEKHLAMLKGGHNKFWGRFYVVA